MVTSTARTMLGIANPRVALLSNGEESEKGSELVQAAHPLIAALPIQFVGNVEQGHLPRGCDVGRHRRFHRQRGAQGG